MPTTRRHFIGQCLGGLALTPAFGSVPTGQAKYREFAITPVVLKTPKTPFTIAFFFNGVNQFMISDPRGVWSSGGYSLNPIKNAGEGIPGTWELGVHVGAPPIVFPRKTLVQPDTSFDMEVPATGTWPAMRFGVSTKTEYTRLVFTFSNKA